jgi:two-component system KDP operon response regulator KdpE
MFVEGQSAMCKRLLNILKESYEVLTYRSGEEALKDVNMIHVDLVIMDTMAPEDNRLDVCRRMRKFTEVPIILIADKAPDTGKVQGLNAGADDYITAPVSEEELVARVQAIFKRQHIPERTSEPLSVGNLCIDSARREVFVCNKPVDLTRIEFDLLYTLVANREAVLTHRQLLEKVWGPDYANETHYLWVSISRLRKKLEARDNGTHYIHNQPGVGYYFNSNAA